jgi:hypothetical protein
MRLSSTSWNNEDLSIPEHEFSEMSSENSQILERFKYTYVL